MQEHLLIVRIPQLMIPRTRESAMKCRWDAWESIFLRFHADFINCCNVERCLLASSPSTINSLFTLSQTWVSNQEVETGMGITMRDFNLGDDFRIVPGSNIKIYCILYSYLNLLSRERVDEFNNILSVHTI